MSNRNNKDNLPLPGDPAILEKWAEDVVNLIMPIVLRRLDAILPEYICEQVLKHINYPMDFKQVAFLLNTTEDNVRKWDCRGAVCFSKVKGRKKMITLQDLCKQIGTSAILQHIRNKH